MGHHGPAAFWQECTREFRQSGAGQCDIVVYPLPSLAEAKIKSLAEELSVYLSWASQLGEKEEFFLGGLPARAFGLNPESPWVQSICLFLDKFDIVVLF
ncbi:MAG: hypothetical protein NZ899_15355, partial [Thermoguttaceae bacterium]|nr:hypothetical protein [Thermoguttaceae bacterium]